MVKHVFKYTNYVLALVLILWVVLGYNILPFFIGSLSIYLGLFIAYIVSNRTIRFQSDSQHKPYRILISEQKLKDSSQSVDAKQEADPNEHSDDMEEEGYDEEQDPDLYIDDLDDEVQDYTFHDQQDAPSTTGFDTEYRQSKLNKVLEVVNKIPRMGGIEFEEFLRDLYDALGYVVYKTDINDQGADLIVLNGEEKIVIQAKRYKNKVSNSAIQQVYTAKAFYDCHKAIVITNSEFTKSAREVAEKVGVELWDSASLQTMLSSMKSMISKT